MQGSLTQIQLPEILQFLSMGKGSGKLRLSRGGQEIELFVRNGKIINSSSLERQRRLGELLIQRGILRRSTLSEVLKLQRTIESDKRLGQILTERDIVNEQTIREVLRLQLEEEIWSLFNWEEGEFKFDAYEDSKLGDDIVSIEIEPLILEGTRRHDEWKKILKVFPEDNIVLTVCKIGDDFKRELKLSPAEWKVLAQLNGRCTIRAVINRSAMGRFEVFQILYNFLKKGIVVTRAADAAAPAGTPVAGKAPEHAGAAEPQKRGGLLAMITGGAKNRTERSSDMVECVSPVGAMAAFINAMMDNFLNTKEQRTATQDRNALDRMWRELVMTYTRADLVVVEGNRVYAERIEGYFDLFEFSPAIQDSYEDTMEALFQLLDIAYRMFATRIGDRAAAKVVRDTLADLGPRLHLRHGEAFNIEERVQALLKLAA